MRRVLIHMILQQGMAIGYASAGGTAIGEIQFADYIFPAFDQESPRQYCFYDMNTHGFYDMISCVYIEVSLI